MADTKASRASRTAEKASAAVETHWEGKPGSEYAHAKAAEAHLKAARAHMAEGNLAKSNAHIELANRHSEKALGKVKEPMADRHDVNKLSEAAREASYSAHTRDSVPEDHSKAAKINREAYKAADATGRTSLARQHLAAATNHEREYAKGTRMEHASDRANKESGIANSKTGTATDHQVAADAHLKAAAEHTKGGNEILAENHRGQAAYHKEQAAKAEKSSGGGGGGERDRDDQGRYA